MPVTSHLDATDADFEQKVIERSRQTPVVVDFWAPWCGPCLSLGPVLEKLAGEPDAGFELVKINVDESPQSSAAMGVRGIPYVVAFKDGEPVNAFTGALPEADVRRFLKDLLGRSEAELEAKIRPVLEALERGDLERAEELLKPLRVDPEAAPALAALNARLHLARYAADHALTLHDGEPDPEQVLAREVHEILGGNYAPAFEAILEVLQRSPAHRDDAHALLLDVIHLVDEASARDLRRRLATALY